MPCNGSSPEVSVTTNPGPKSLKAAPNSPIVFADRNLMPKAWVIALISSSFARDCCATTTTCPC